MWLIIGDLHLTDLSRDQYRFGIFDWIRKRQAKIQPAATFLLGDITDSKDRHSATLVNQIVGGLVSLKPPVYILKGNHDYSDPKNPFFKFLNHIEGLKFVVDPTMIKAVRPIAMIPHYRKQDDFDSAVRSIANHDPDCFLVHQTFDGAIAESGVRLSGLSAACIESIDPVLGVYAGDVHKPQTQGLVTYVGCPYHVRFGDDFDPSCLEVSKTGVKSFPWFDAPRKWSLTVRGPENILNHKDYLMEGDQVKLTIELAREETVTWNKIKQEVLAACKKLKLDVYGVKMEVKSAKPTRLRLTKENESPLDALEQFCKAEKVASKIKKVGMEFLNGNKDDL